MNTHRPFPRKAIFLGLVIALMIVGFAAEVVWRLRTESWTTALRNSRDVSTSIAHDVERSLQTYDLSMQSIVIDLTTAGIMELPPDLRDRVLFDSSIKAKYLGPIVVVDRHGSVYLDSASRLPHRENLGERDFFRFHQADPSPTLHIGHPFRAPSGEYRITLSRRLTLADGGFAGIVVGTMELAYFEDLFGKIELGEQGALGIALDDGTLLARAPIREADLGRNLKGTHPFDEMAAQGRGNLRARGAIDGVDRQYTFQHIGNFPLVLTVAQSSAAIDGPWQDRALLIGVLTGLLLLGCGALGYILHRELARRHVVESELFAESERLQVTLRSIGDAVVTTDREGRVLFMNPVAEALSGWPVDRARGRPSQEVLRITGPDGSGRTIDPIARALAGQPRDDASPGSHLQHVDGRRFAVEDSVAPIRDSAGDVIGAVMVLHDVTEARAMVDRMKHLAQHDALTGLPNRVLFHERLDQAIEHAQRERRRAAVLFLDLDRFKHVNDSLGHLAGDRLLVEMSRRLQDCVREGDTVSRQGGDEFVLLLADLADDAGPSRVADSILRRIAQPFEVGGHVLSVTGSLGMAIFPEDGGDAASLTRHADAAMYLAKQSGRNAWRSFTSELGDQALQRLNVEHRLADALAKSEFILHYQPLCRASDGMPIAAEALVRWRRDGIVVPPADFIAVAEECGQIVGLGDEILRMACRQAVVWNRNREEPFVVAVNVSAHQFRSTGFVGRVVDILHASGLAAHCLELEITESVFLQEVERTEVILRELKQVGVSIALDDFGTGYSSLSYLSRFPVDRIKIDRSFISTLATHGRNKAIVQTIVRLGHDLGLKVIAEGVETVEQRKILSAMGCLELQGYLFGRPSAEFEPGLALDDIDGSEPDWQGQAAPLRID